MTYQSNDADTGSDVGDAARATGRGLLWLAIVIGMVLVVLGVFLVGPFGLAIAIPALLVIWLAASWSAGGPAAGA